MAHRLRWLALAMTGLIFCMGAIKSSNNFVPFDQFIKNTRSATLASFVKNERVKVRNEAEFQRMKAHVLSLYDGVKVSNSFVLDADEHVDCVDINTQPALRGRKLATPPPPMATTEYPPEDPKRRSRGIAPQLDANKKDRFGHVQYCKQGFIPMRRVTLDEIVRYATLDDFFNKYGHAGEKGNPPEGKQ